MTTREKEVQYRVLQHYRRNNVLPSMSEMARKSSVTISTVSLFMHGNSKNESLRKYATKQIEQSTEITAEAEQLLEIWDNI